MTTDLQLLPLGGCGQVGLNATWLATEGQSLLIDCGVELGVLEHAGVSRLLPDLSLLEDPAFRPRALLLTHGHLDHIGAIPALLERMPMTVYGTPTTLAFVSQLFERGRPPSLQLNPIEAGERLKLGPFAIEAVRMSHSIPGALGFWIQSAAGSLFHSGDFRIDPTAQEPTDEARLKAIGEAGLDLLLADSTNAEREHADPPEVEVHKALEETMRAVPGRTVVSLVSSHLHRIQAVTEAARRQGKRIALLGRSLEASWRIGQITGLLPGDPSIRVKLQHLDRVARNEVIVIATGAQGEHRGGLARIASGQDPKLMLHAGDQLIVSARTIPGNEKAVRHLHNRFLRQGVRLVLSPAHAVHSSGHASRAEQAKLLRWLKPRAFVPIHGDRSMLEAHAALARECGIPPERVRIPENGQRLDWIGGELKRGPSYPLSPVPLSDFGGPPLTWEAVKRRQAAGRQGVLMLHLRRSPRGELCLPITTMALGLPELEPLEPQLATLLAQHFRATERQHRLELEPLRRLLKRFFKATWGQAPELELAVTELDRDADRAIVINPQGGRDEHSTDTQV